MTIAFIQLLLLSFLLGNDGQAITPSHPVILANIESFQPLPSFREVGEAISLEELEIEDWREDIKEKLTEDRLIKLSVRLRELARYLGTNLPIVARLDSEGQVICKITDMIDSEGNWLSMTLGQVIKLVSQELELLKTSEPEPLIDLLVKDEISGKYRPLLDVSLSRYCYELLQAFNF